VEHLRAIVHEIFLEGAQLYTSKLSMLTNLKKTNELTEEIFDNMRFKFNAEMDEAEKGVYEKHKLTEFFVQDWLNKFKGDKDIDEKLA